MRLPRWLDYNIAYENRPVLCIIIHYILMIYLQLTNEFSTIKKLSYNIQNCTMILDLTLELTKYKLPKY